MRTIIRQKLADSLAESWPQLTRRVARLPAIPKKAHAIVGMRRSGKTCFLKQCLADKEHAGAPRDALVYFNFEDERLAGMQTEHLSWILEEYFLARPQFRDSRDVTFCFDEIQGVPNWATFIRRVLDSEKMSVFVSGSSARMLSREVASALRGRAVETIIFPFSFAEFLTHQGIEIPENPAFVPKAVRSQLESSFAIYLTTGGFPEAQGLEPRDRLGLLQGYVDLVIFRDVVERHKVTNVEALRRLVRRLLASPGGLFSINRFANDLHSQGVAAGKTVLHSMLSWLEDSFLVRIVPINTTSERQRQVNPRKIYPIDMGLIAAFDRSGRSNIGHGLETAVLLELERRSLHVTYVRTKSGGEVDFLATGPDGVKTYIQVCADLGAPEVRKRELQSLVEVMSTREKAQHLLLTLLSSDAAACQKDAPAGVKIQPAWEWMLDRPEPQH
jgi:predicted AAA+ superfamily ATPase